MNDSTQQDTSLPTKYSQYILTIAVFLVPVFFLPFLSFQFSKMIFVSLAVLVTFILYLVSIFKHKTIVIPKTLIMLSVLLIPLTLLLSSLFTETSDVLHSSLIGYGFEIGTTAFVILLFLALFTSIVLFKSRESIFYVYLAFFGASFVVILFQITKLFFPEILVFQTFVGPIANMIGKWNSMGIFVGLGAILSVVTLESITLSKVFKNILRLLLALALFVLVVVNFKMLWVVIGIIALLFALYLWKHKTPVVTEEGAVPASKKISPYISILVGVALIAFFAFPLIGKFTLSSFNISYIEAKPDWTATYNIAKEAFSSSPLLGVGPNRFLNTWYELKPLSVNLTQFWNTDFYFAVGFVPTLMIETGIIGSVLWIAFFVLLGLTMVRAFRMSIADKFSRYILVSTLVSSLFLWIMAIFYTPGIVLLFLTFMFTGLFLATFYMLSEKQFTSISWGVNHPKVFKIIVLIMIIGTALWGVLITSRALSSVYFQKGIQAFNTTGNAQESARLINKAITLSPNDTYYRALAELNLFRLGALINGTLAPQTTIENDVSVAFKDAETSAGNAVFRNRRNYNNWLLLGNVYEVVVGAKVEGAYENALGSYGEAIAANPTNPALYLTVSRLEASQNKLDRAKDFAQRALQLKPNFTQAAFLLSQIEVALGNTANAIRVVENALIEDPNNSTGHFQLGFLKYNTNDYRGAVEAFSNAILLVPDYANAKYFRGLSAVKLGDRTKALVDFEDIQKSNPDNEEIKLIISNLKSGKDPFANAQPPVDIKPEKREELPLEEQ